MSQRARGKVLIESPPEMTREHTPPTPRAAIAIIVPQRLERKSFLQD
ncbi:hypothetical protein [Geobacter sp. SVR]|nr:hypothetical protein [Geobacter sp. SVR]